MKRCKVMEMVKNMLLTCIMALFGALVLVLKDSASLETVLRVFNYVFLAAGVYMIVHYFVNAKELSNAGALVLGATFVVSGIILLLAIDMIIYLSAIAFALVGAYYFGRAFEQKKAGKAWLKELIAAALHMVLGLAYFLLLTYTNADVIVMIGVVFLVSSVYQCVSMFVFKEKKAE